MDSEDINGQLRSATNGASVSGGSGGGGGAVRRRPPTAPYTASASSSSPSYGTNEEDSLLYNPSQHHNEEGYPFPQERNRRSYYGGGRSYQPQPWYRQPQKLILGATLAWVGGVMYLASLAHAILRTHKETANMMGGSLMDNHEGFKEWLGSQKKGMPQRSSSASARKYGASASDEDVTKWLEARNAQVYGASAETDEDFQRWLENKNNYGKYNANAKYGDGDSSGSSGEAYDEDFQQWAEYQYDKVKNSYSASDETLSDFQQWSDKYGATGGSSASKTRNSRFGSDYGDAWQDWLEYLESEKGTNSGGSYRNGVPDDWSQYQNKNKKQVKYDANGQERHFSSTGASLPSAAEPLPSLSSVHQQPAAAVASPLDSAPISTIDWPVQGLAHTSCTVSNGCLPSTNVTVLVVYGPEYHTHISEMAWNVATGVHSAFESHIHHHPSSPLHGHIVFGHTSNVTFLDVKDADAVIIGSPVYNGNVHPDVQNWINYWHIDADLSNKFGGAFATAGGIHAGADGTIMSILRSMMVFQMMAVGGDSWTSPFGAVATVWEDPFGDTQRTEYFDSACYYAQANGRQGDHLVHPYFLRKAYGLGERIANVSMAWKNSSYVRWD
mmetsp:Transcript_30429/g.63622  ORF Transcript_30429/g.63622 Transcript_30429/m.63622 type:complete len:612 (-) Transcript_30429:291-2126(-)